MAKKYMTAEEVLAYLAEHYTAKDLSIVADISTQHAHSIINKGVFPSARVLDMVGINRIYEVQK